MTDREITAYLLSGSGGVAFGVAILILILTGTWLWPMLVSGAAALLLLAAIIVGRPMPAPTMVPCLTLPISTCRLLLTVADTVDDLSPAERSAVESLRAALRREPCPNRYARRVTP